MISNDTVIKYCNEGFNSDILTVVFKVSFNKIYHLDKYLKEQIISLFKFLRT